MKRMLANGVARVLSVPVLMLWYAAGWRAEGRLPDIDKYVIIAAPHTSNWDYAQMVALAARFQRKPSTLIKDKVFEWPVLGTLVRWGGGIPIVRSESRNIVKQIADRITESERIVLAITPEGTRRKTEYWRSGFYYIAKEANVPIVLSFLDYRRKRAGGGEIIYPSGDIEADMDKIRAYYAAHGYGRHPENTGEIRIRPSDRRTDD